MKIILLLLISVSCFGQYKNELGVQAKIDSVKDVHAKQTEVLKAQRSKEINRPKEINKAEDRQQYEKFVKVSVNDINMLIKGIDRLKNLEMYNPNSTDKEKIDNYKFLEAYINELRGKLKIDSAVVHSKK